MHRKKVQAALREQYKKTMKREVNKKDSSITIIITEDSQTS